MDAHITEIAHHAINKKDTQAIDFDFDFNIISPDPISATQLYAQKHNVSLNAVLIATFAGLVYRYQNEEQFQIVLHVKKNLISAPLFSLELPLDDQVTASGLVDRVSSALEINGVHFDNIAPARLLEPFYCLYSSGDNSSGNITALFEISLDGNIIVSSLDSTSSDHYLKRWTEHFSILFSHMFSEPDQSISLLPLLSRQEQETLDQWSVSLVDPVIAQPQCLHQLFEHTVNAFGDNPALRCMGNELTYDEFNIKANALARYLRSHGVNTGDFIAILLPRALDVFIAIMGVLKAGAAYVPIDPRSPAERIGYILDDAQARLVITDTQLKNKNQLSCECVCVEDFPECLKAFSTHNLLPEETGVVPDDPAYIIYTSGTTGKPKGVVLMHKTVSNLIGGESNLFCVNNRDRIYQGFSISFDASVEEMWLAWYSGAVLVAATKAEALSGPDLVTFLQTEKITVFSTVPTQISMMQTPAESVRILILGGEECHLRAIEPWLDGKRKIYNTYGPTEATVIATCGECIREMKPGIGKPAPNYAVYILDRNLQPVPEGMYGELCIGGHCLAREYLNRPELTSKKFVTPPFTVGNGFPQRLYRSGDRARFASDGSLEFGGRIDSQIKLRGQRIELGEIEAALVKACDASQAAVALSTNAQGIQSLVGYLVSEKGKNIDEKRLKSALNSFLPSYMVPSKFCSVEELPVLPSGKVDRKRLASLQVEETREEIKLVQPRTGLEKTIHAAWAKFFDRKDISVTDNFFDLGGHSLLAANIISELRTQQGMGELPLQYMYQYRTIEEMAAAVEKNFSLQPHTIEAKESATSDQEQKLLWLRFILCGSSQAIALYPIFMLFSTPLLIPFVIDWFNPAIGVVAWAVVSFVSMLALLPVLTIVSIISKWLLIGRYKSGVYKLWGFFYLRFWFVSRLMDLVPTRMMRGTPFLVWYYRLMGARIGKNVHIGSDKFRVCDLVSIGDNSSINADAHLMAYRVTRGMLHIGSIAIGQECTVGTRSVLDENTVMKDHSELGELALLPSGMIVGEGEYWEGSPAAKTMGAANNSENIEQKSRNKASIFYLTVFACAFLSAVIIPCALLLPWIVAAFYLYVNTSLAYTLPATIPMAATYTISFCLAVAGIKKLIFPCDKESCYDIYSITYIRKWLVDTLVQMSLFTVQPLYATIYLPHWLRLLGAKIGKRAEISTVDHISADLLSLGDGSFIADSASVGPTVVRKGKMYVGKAEVGRRSFIGNSALIPIGTRIGDNCLVGVLSKPPQDTCRKIINNTNWLGSPPMVLPHRQESQKFKLRLTFDPPAYLVVLRGLIEFFKITMPAALTSCCYILSYWFVSEILGPVALLRWYIFFSPLVIFGGSLALALLTVVAKWLLVGRYRQVQIPLWSLYLWKNEFINSLCENMVYPLLTQMIQGTPFLPAYFRLLGSRIGKHVYMETTEITEFDLVRIGDNATLNYGCTIQTHLFEDRVMKMSNLHIEDSVTIGPMSVVLYDTHIRKGTVLDGLSLVMKGETLPSSTAWFGIPARSQPHMGADLQATD